MEITYLVKGIDGKEYGPVSLAQITGWAQEGRLAADQEVKRSDMDYWARAGDFSELQALFTAAAPQAVLPTVPGVIRPAARPVSAPLVSARAKSGSSWFYFVAVLSLVNSISAFSGSNWHFLIGLGASQLFDAIGGAIGGAGRAVALGLNLVVAAVFILFGILGGKGQAWAILVGMILFGMDALILVWAQDWLSLAFHAYVLFRLFGAFQACRSAKG